MRDYCNRKEAAKLSGVSERTILRAITSKQLTAQKVGDGKTSTYLISRSALQVYSQRKGRK